MRAVVPLYPPHSRVGAWLATHEYLRHLASLGHQVEVSRYMARREPGYTLDGVHVHDRVKVVGADVLISHMGDNGNAHREAVDLGIPSVRMIHGPTDEAAQKIAGASLTVCNSQATFDALDWDGPRIICRPITRPELHRTSPGDRVTMVNTSKPKGGELLPYLASALPSIGFLTVRGGYGTQVNKPGPNIVQMDRVDDMRTVWSQTRILIVPSEAESWGMVGVEAMTCGIPVIAHPTPGLRESLGDAGIFVDRGDLGGWIEAITRLQDRHEWEVASMRAEARASQLRLIDDRDLFARSIEALVTVDA